MKISLLDLITTPVPVLNTLGLRTRVGLSSEDPMVLRHPSEEYQAYLTVYSPEGVLLGRSHLGDIPPNRRQFFDVSAACQELVPSGDHLAVVHRVPSKLLEQVSSVDQPVEVERAPDYFGYRSCVEYSYPGGANGSLIYETPPMLNVPRQGRPPSDSLSFSSKTVLSESVDTYVVLIHYSMEPSYSAICEYHYSFFTPTGELAATGDLRLAPFSIQIIDVAQVVPQALFQQHRDPSDGLAPFTFVGYTDQAAVIPLFFNASRTMGAISVEHANPAQEYLIPASFNDRRSVKSRAVAQWKAGLAAFRR